jgi:hypothetical protein
MELVSYSAVWYNGTKERMIKLFKNFSAERQREIINRCDAGGVPLSNDLYVELYKIYINNKEKKNETINNR